MIGKKLASIALAGVLAATLGPAAALAAPIEAGSVAASTATAPLQTQAAKTKTIFVPVKMTVKKVDGGTAKKVEAITFAYNKKGLLVKKTIKAPSSKASVFKYGYKGTKLTKVATSDAKMTFAYKNGRKAKGKWVMALSSSDNVMETYAYKSGKIAKVKSVAQFMDPATEELAESTTIVKYGYKKGLPVKVKETQGDYTMTTSYAYDAKGNYKTIKGFETTKFVNTYKKGLLKKRVQKPQNDGEAELVTTITYKKVKVPSKYASTVKAQTWSILNYNLNYATGGRMMS